jgi:hypothetical protein
MSFLLIIYIIPIIKFINEKKRVQLWKNRILKKIKNKKKMNKVLN